MKSDIEMKNIPNEIYLVIDPDSLEGIDVSDFKDHEGITWSDVRMNETDLYYVHESELATLRSQMQESKWISVEDRLPEDCYTLVIISYNKTINVGYYNSDIKKWIDTNYWHYKDNVVTHWQPLPEPPDPLTKY